MSSWTYFVLFFVMGIFLGVRYIIIGWRIFKYKKVHLAIEESFINGLYGLFSPQQVARYTRNLKYQFVGMRYLFFGFVFTLLAIFGMIFSLNPEYQFTGTQYLIFGFVAIPGVIFSLLEVITTYAPKKK